MKQLERRIIDGCREAILASSEHFSGTDLWSFECEPSADQVASLSSLFNGKQTWKGLNPQNGFRTTLERLSCHKDFKITQAQTKVSFFYLNPSLQVEFRAIFEPFPYILLNGSKSNDHKQRLGRLCIEWRPCGFLYLFGLVSELLE